MHFSLSRKDPAIPLFVKNSILPISFLYVESICNVMYEVKDKIVPVNLRNLFDEISDIHS